MPFGIQPWHLVVIFIVALIIFGPSKLPELGRSVGKTLNEFRNGAREMTDSLKDEINKGDQKPAESTPTVPVQIAPSISSVPTEPNIASAPNPVSAPSGIFCVSCGAPNPADARFCKNCGKALVV